ncbi:MAG TPA: lamin tail domain-containing protein [Bacteroidia bacterium]|nr:lamin tail domain-containing protein [Bacteroidia bacterium]
MKNIFLLVFLLPFLTTAQITDDFSDGDFTNNPSWSGDVANWQVVSGQLVTNGPAVTPTTTYLSLPSTFVSDAQWDFFVNPKCATSSGNFMDIYLISDVSDVTNASGYFVRIGGTPDEVSLFKRIASVETKIIDGQDGTIASSSDNPTKIRVKRTTTSDWTLEADFSGTGTNYSLQGTVNDATITASSFFGIKVTYSASNNQKYFFDDLSIGNIVIDITPPSVNSITNVTQNAIDAVFSEAVDQTTAETISNYSVDNSIGNPTTAALTSSNTVHLTFATNFSNGVTNTLSVLNVKDLNNNPITVASTAQFTYSVPVAPSKYDVVITEFMADPDPPIGLPNAEYVEIYNRSNKTFDLNGWKISDSGSPNDLTSFILLPHSYLILCSTSTVSLFTSFGNVLGVSSFPTFNNPSGGGNDDIVISDNNSVIIDKIHYDELWFRDPSKINGGWSIERINPDFTCYNSLNWKASVNPAGGTPGTTNSVDGTFSETEPPLLLRAAVAGNNSVNVYFDEPMNAAILSAAASYTADNGFGNPASLSPAPDFTSVTLTFSSVIQNGIIYTLTVSSSITDCAGNSLSGNNTVRFAIPDSVISVSDILLNEILFNAKDAGVSFVEIYNRSNKIFDLSKTKIGNLRENTDTINYLYPIAVEGFLFFPGDYLALTKSPAIVKLQYQTTNPSGFVTVENLENVIYTDDATVLITDDNSNRIDQFYYSTDFQFPLLNDPEGVSLERISFNRPTQDSTNWHSAAETVGFATPAYENSQHAEVVDDGSEVSVEPEIFSPDNDGNNDVVNINYHFGEPGYIANLKIFDSKGREIIHLIKNELLGTTGTFTWNGITKENEKAKVGIYVAYLEIFNEKGTVKKFKKPVVLASKL